VVRALVRLSSALLLISASLAFSAVPAAAAAFTVNTTNDGIDANVNDGACATAGAQCSLRAAIEQANFAPGADTIILPAGEYHPNMGQLTLSDSATIQGAGAATTIIDPDTPDRIFRIENTATATISGVTVRGGGPPDHGGGIVNLGNLTLLSVAVRDNSAGQSGGGIQTSVGTASLTIDRSTITGNQASDGSGGGIDFGTMGSLTITNSTITNNSATIDGGGIYHGGTGGTTSITNTTVSGNRANANSGGIHIFSTATIASSTITANRADNDASGSGNGGGASVGAGGSLTLERTMLAGNTDASAGAEAPDCSTGPMSGDSNLIGNTANCAYVPGPTDKVNVNPLVGALADNGGSTMTHALLTGSPAIDGVTGTCEAAADQRGVPRPQGTGCDIGAYELALCSGEAVNRLALADVPFEGTSGPDVVLGTSGNDTIDVGGGDDKLCAGAGDDQLTGGAGNDALDGGTGTDRVVGLGDVDFVLTPTLLIGLGTDSLTSIEQATLTGGVGHNLLDASGFLGPVVLNGGDGFDGLFGGPGNDALDGGPGFDNVLAEGNVNFTLTNASLIGQGSDILKDIETAFIFGGPVGNKIDASSASSIDLFAICGGGADTILGGSSEFGDFILGEGGKDIIRGGGGPDLLFGGGGKDRLAGQAGDDFVFGDSGDDRLAGGAGKDRLMGGRGRDALDGGKGKDVCVGGKQLDTARRCEKVRGL
jgi:CSLREA domain-containing protein